MVLAGGSHTGRCLLSVIALTAICSLLLLPLPMPAGASNVTAPESEIKAAYLYNFTKFITWPAASFSSPGAPLKICIFDDRPVGAVLRDVHGKSAGNRAIEVFQTRNPADVAACHILFIGSTDRNTRSRLIEATRGKAVLTVGEDEGFADQGGGINFFVAKEKVMFEINPDVIKRSGLEVSSRLLAIARIVRDTR